MHESAIHISLQAEKIANWFFPITNTLVAIWFSMFALIIFALFVRFTLRKVPGKLQAVVEALFEYVIDYMEEVLEDRKLARKLFPIVMTIFLFVLVSNWAEHLPIFETIFTKSGDEHAALLRSANTDLNTTLALAIISFFTVEIIGVSFLGFRKYFKKFINFSGFLPFVIGVIELISEIARLIAFSFRLFGNILAGMVLILVAKHFVPYLLPVPLMAFEIFVGFIQAAIFALLTLYFVKLAIMEPEHA